MTETTIMLVRHGETDWNASRRVQGHTDRPLNETGRAQALELARALADERLDAVYSSDLVRSLDTARAVAEPRDLEVTTMRELRERNFGTWEGLSDDEILARFPEARTGPWGDAETQEEMATRVLDALRLIGVRHAGGRVLVVTHGGPMRAVFRHCSADGDGPIANCHVSRIAIREETVRRID